MSAVSVREFSYNPSAVFVRVERGEAMAAFTEILVTDEIRDWAANLPGGVRTLDAIHIASAQPSAMNSPTSSATTSARSTSLTPSASP